MIASYKTATIKLEEGIVGVDGTSNKAACDTAAFQNIAR